MESDSPRSHAARKAAETALVRVVHHYGKRPEFVVLGGLVPELLCTRSEFRHAGTTDVDVQVNLEIECGAVNTARLEHALLNAEFEPDNERVWRWSANIGTVPTVVKFELLADLNEEKAGDMIHFNGCENLGAVNLRGTGFVSRDIVIQSLSARIGGKMYKVEVNVTGLAGFLLAKTAAAYSRRKPKDWYDIAFVLLYNDDGGPREAALTVKKKFSGDLDAVRTALNDLLANFETPDAQGSRAYVQQMRIDHPDLDTKTLTADAMLAVQAFHSGLFPKK